MTGKDRRNYTPSESADGAEICSPMEPKHNVSRLYYYNRLSDVSPSSLDLVQRECFCHQNSGSYDIVQL